MLQALGYGMLDTEGKQVSFGAKGLAELVSITDENVLPELKECTFQIACDVKNPLCGELGCSAIFGPQKGATPDMIAQMDSLASIRCLLQIVIKRLIPNIPEQVRLAAWALPFYPI
mgnify:CR=1 FL=1